MTISRGRYVEVCAGAGGWGLGLHRAGWSGTGIEWDADAAETHRRHVGPCVTADITTEPTPHLADLVCGGVPCQSFSTAGAREGLGDPRGQLFRALLRHASDARAKVCALENVRGLISCGALPVILAAFRTHGFEPVHALLNACDYGVPQNRVRLFVVGFRDAEDLARFRWPAPTHGAPSNLWGLPAWRTVRDALGLDGAEGSRLDRPSPCLTASEGKSALAFGSRGAETSPRRAGDRLNPLLSSIDRPAPTMKHNSGREGVGPKRASGLLSVDIAESIGDPSREGRLTVRDCARLQSFPDEMEFCGKPESQFRQVGNAVAPPMGEAIARSVWTALYGV